jgi:GTPase SAR1 family protein
MNLNLLLLLISLLLVLILIFYNYKRVKRDTILLMGASATGKTTFLHRLLSNEPITVTSIEPHEIVIGKKKIIDLPGHGRLWFLHERYKDQCLFVIFFLDDRGNGLDLLKGMEDMQVYCIASESAKKKLDKVELQVQLEFVSLEDATQLIRN